MHREQISENTLRSGTENLAERDPDLNGIFMRLGYPPLWTREPGFASLVRIILEQQVSIKAAATMFERLASQLGDVSAESILDAGEKGLRGLGLTRQKSRYCAELARQTASGELQLEQLGALDDEQGRKRLLSVPGLGPWTVDIYYMMALRRPDVWPRGDLALASAIQDIKQLGSRPTPEAQLMFARQWSPWRAVAARMLWMHYLDARGH
ncbi:DNA-3-methyladenine glycosylase 2 family protein [Marinobacter vulgaris]|uniref:DNA-3-methyladenine glycosylase II n=1 Tax=Marinobacter vulgaris TaxID=1928331 RepID=A0A2V3ZGQ1_9GAMM|nr:DNA-3-methyladenine glycosylase [Marinobacter vulgaris]PXX89626.1 DNA-3-methyladenine glycosylase 2 family protein [Marinobacter vulgaris]TSJ68614.1 DNA-3-methyladenine glycosylase 2 family protein [Marinobacter vulgaris]